MYLPNGKAVTMSYLKQGEDKPAIQPSKSGQSMCLVSSSGLEYSWRSCEMACPGSCRAVTQESAISQGL